MIRGACLCGAVTFEVEGPFPELYQCRCSLCRKQGGSASNTGLIVEHAKFRWQAGEDHIVKFALPTGFRSHFCGTCGSTVPNPLRETPYTWVPAGLLDDADTLKVTTHVYVGSRADWDTAPLEGKVHETAPEMLDFIRALHRQG